MNETNTKEIVPNINQLVENDLIPKEWAQIISTDIEKQTQQTIQCPFSDCYSSGMPRKYQKPNKLSNIVNLGESLHKIVKDMKPKDENSTNDVLNEICSDSDIQNNFDNYIKHIVKEHIKCKFDNSFKLEKFVDMNRYLFDSNV